MIKKSIFIFTFLLIVFTVNAQNRLGSRLFHNRPPLFESPSKYNFTHPVKFPFKVVLPKDSRNGYLGETVEKKVRVERYEDYWNKSVQASIGEKLMNDFQRVSLVVPESQQIDSTKVLTVLPEIEVFYPCVKGFLWGKSYSKVRLHMIVKKGGTELLNDKYEAIYVTDGLDKEWEGSKWETIEQGANITIGMCLRKALDKFYQDLDGKL